MPIGIGEDHTELAASIGKWAEALQPREAVKAAEGDAEALAAWSLRYAEMGLAAIAAPEPYGGGTLLDQAVALEAAAHALIPGPLLTTTIAAIAVPGLAEGAADGSVRVGQLLPGGIVADGATATHVLVPTATGWGVVAADQLALTPGADPDLSRTTSVLAGAVPVADEVVDAVRLRRLTATLAAAECSGIAQWCLETAVEYAGVREQFGRKIGSFQAIKHLCAEMLEITESVTAAAWDAATAADDPDQWELATLVAETVCFDGAVQVAKAAVQVLGGIGFTFEHDAHLYLRRAISLRSRYAGAGAADLAAVTATGRRRVLHLEIEDDSLREQARELVASVTSASDQRAALAETGLLAPHWPAPYGLGADPALQLVIDEELEAAGIERPDLKIGAWAAPTILSHGNDAQRERFLGPTLRGEIAWCQLFSEPEAGSDLAGLRTRAVRDDAAGGWRLTGQKVWTSLARESDWGICLARTDADAKPHAGITYFVLDMRTPGIDIRPLRELTGEAMFNEVFLDDVFIPDECVVGEVNGGWRLAVTTLANERVAMAGARLGDSVERALAMYDELGDAARSRVGDAVAWATVVKLLGTRATMRSLAGQGPGSESSVAKLVGVRSRQDSAELVVELLGARALGGGELATAALHEQLLTRCLSIAGGTTQILRNVAGERILGLPR